MDTKHSAEIKLTECGTWLNKEVLEDIFLKREKEDCNRSSLGDWENDVVIWKNFRVESKTGSRERS